MRKICFICDCEITEEKFAKLKHGLFICMKCFNKEICEKCGKECFEPMQYFTMEDGTILCFDCHVEMALE